MGAAVFDGIANVIERFKKSTKKISSFENLLKSTETPICTLVCQSVSQ
jgi:hypothetical protein